MSITRYAFLSLSLVAATLTACSGGSDPAPAPTAIVPPPSAGDVQNLGSYTIPAGRLLSTPIAVTAQGASSLLLMAIPNDSQRPGVITNVKSPSGQTLVTADANDLDPIGKNLFQQATFPVTAGMLPQTTTYTFENGQYQFQIGNPHNADTTVQLWGVVNHRLNPTGGTLDVNLVFCGIEDISAQTALSDQRFLTILTEFRRILAQAGIQPGNTLTFDCPNNAASEFAVLEGSEEQAQLFSLRPPDDANIGLNIFFVQDIQLDGIAGVLGISGGIPGPARMQGTGSSGIAISLVAPRIGSLQSGDLVRRGRTMAHEVGHYLGLFHATERTGSTPSSPTNFVNVDPIPDTPECLATVDLPPGGDGDQGVDPTECGIAGGARNLMFWTQGPDSLGPRDQISANQSFVLVRNPLVR
ncbi:MAG: hypothetical protein U0172_13370 [Nitrospiraceae bacterium]